jgi:hypothetical protein
MPHNLLCKFLCFLLLALPLTGCAVTSQDLRQEIQDERRGTREKMEQAEKSYESRRYLGLTSDKSEEWNSTDWTLWMDTHGGGH